MVQIRTLPKRVRVRSALDPRWILAFGFGIAVSLAYYGLLIWAGIWLVRALLGLLVGS